MGKGNDPRIKVWISLEYWTGSCFKSLERQKGSVASYMRVALDHVGGLHAERKGQRLLSLVMRHYGILP